MSRIEINHFLSIAFIMMATNRLPLRPMLRRLIFIGFLMSIVGGMPYGCVSSEPEVIQEAYIVNNSDETVFAVCDIPWIHEFFSIKYLFINDPPNDLEPDPLNYLKRKTLYPGDSLKIELTDIDYTGLMGPKNKRVVYALKLSTLNKYSKQEIIDRDISDACLHISFRQARINNVFFLF